jgi:uncharacterized protein with HEPN domain
MEKDPKIFLSHILENIASVERDLEGVSKSDFKWEITQKDLPDLKNKITALL